MYKKILMSVFLASLALTGTNAKTVNANQALDALNLINKYQKHLEVYMKTKKKRDIKDEKTKIAVTAFCKYGCGKTTCGKSGKPKEMANNCKNYCPEKNIKNCLKAAGM